MARRTKSRTPRRAPPARKPAPAKPAPRAAARTAAKGAAPGGRQAEIERLDRLADLLDSRFRIPVVGWRFGLDSVIGLIPGVGDVVTLGPMSYILWQGRRLGVSNRTLTKMAANVGIDFVVGSIPVLGDLFDVGFKANRRNIELLKRDLRGPPR